MELARKVTLWSTKSHIKLHACAKNLNFWWSKIGEVCRQKLTMFKVIFDLFTVCVYFIQQQNWKLYCIYLMIISKIQSEIGYCSCDSTKFKAPADFNHHAILYFTLSLRRIYVKCLRTCLRQNSCFIKHWRIRMFSLFVLYVGQINWCPSRYFCPKWYMY